MASALGLVFCFFTFVYLQFSFAPFFFFFFAEVVKSAFCVCVCKEECTVSREACCWKHHSGAVCKGKNFFVVQISTI